MSPGRSGLWEELLQRRDDSMRYPAEDQVGDMREWVVEPVRPSTDRYFEGTLDLHVHVHIEGKPFAPLPEGLV